MGGLSIGPIFWALAALGGAAGVAYGIYFLRRPPSLVRALVKTLFMGATAAALMSAHAPFPLVFAIIVRRLATSSWRSNQSGRCRLALRPSCWRSLPMCSSSPRSGSSPATTVR